MSTVAPLCDRALLIKQGHVEQRLIGLRYLQLLHFEVQPEPSAQQPSSVRFARQRQGRNGRL